MADSATITSDVDSGAVINSDTGDVEITSNVIEETVVSSDVGETGPAGPPGDQGPGAAVTIGGNTAGAAALISTGTMFLAGGNNVTLSQNGQSISFIGGAGVGGGGAALSAGTQSVSTGTVAFADSNNVTFGMSGSNQITASASFSQSVQTQGLMSLNGSSGQLSLVTGSSLSSSQNGSTITFGLASNITTALQSAGAYLTTAAQSNAVVQSINGSTGTFSFMTASSLSSSRNGNSISFGLASNITTALQPAGAYLTTARASNDAIGLNTAQSNVTWTANSSGLSLDARGYAGTGTTVTNATLTVNSNGVQFNGGAYLTTAAASNHSHGNPTLALTNLSGTTASNSAGFTLSLSAVNALTTAMASNRGSDFVQANAAFAGTNASGTIASNGISVSVNPAAAGVGIAAGTRTATTAGNLLFDTGNGVTFGLNAVGGSIMTASHNGLTTARASTDAIGLATAQTNVTWTANSAGLSLNAGGYAGTNTATTGNISVTLNTSGISINAPAFLTTAAQSSASNISGVIAATASNGATNQTAQLSGAVSFANGSGVSFFTTVSGATSGIAASVKTDYQTAGAYLTTARASNDAVGLNTALTANGVAWTVNSSGLSLNVPAFLTTAALSNHSHGNPTLALTNLSGTTASASNGLTLSLSAAAPGAGGGIANAAGTQTATSGTVVFSNSNNVSFGMSNSSVVTASATFAQSVQTQNLVAVIAGTQLASSGTVSFIDSQGISFGMSNGMDITATVKTAYAGFGTSATNASITMNSAGLAISVAAPGAAAENNNINLLGANTAGNTTASGSTIGYSGINLTLSGTNGSIVNISAPATSSLVATGRLSFSTNGSTISMGVVAAVTESRYNEFKETPMVAGNIGQATLHMQPWLMPNLQFDRVVVHKIFSNASNSSGSFTVSDWVGIYTLNVSTLSLLHSASYSTNFSGSGTVGSYLSYGGGLKAVTMGLTQTLTEGMYWIGVINRTTTGGVAGHTLNQALNSQVNTTYQGLMGAATNASNQITLGNGIYSVSTSAMPASVAFTELRGNSSVFLRPPSLYFISGTV